MVPTSDPQTAPAPSLPPGSWGEGAESPLWGRLREGGTVQPGSAGASQECNSSSGTRGGLRMVPLRGLTLWPGGLLKASLLRRVRETSFGGTGEKCRTNAGPGRPLPCLMWRKTPRGVQRKHLITACGVGDTQHSTEAAEPFFGEGGERRGAGAPPAAPPPHPPSPTKRRAGGPGMGCLWGWGGGVSSRDQSCCGRGWAGSGGARRGFPRARSGSADARALLSAGQMGRARVAPGIRSARALKDIK